MRRSCQIIFVIRKHIFCDLSTSKGDKLAPSCDTSKQEQLCQPPFYIMSTWLHIFVFWYSASLFTSCAHMNTRFCKKKIFSFPFYNGKLTKSSECPELAWVVRLLNRSRVKNFPQIYLFSRPIIRDHLLILCTSALHVKYVAKYCCCLIHCQAVPRIFCSLHFALHFAFSLTLWTEILSKVISFWEHH